MRFFLTDKLLHDLLHGEFCALDPSQGILEPLQWCLRLADRLLGHCYFCCVVVFNLLNSHLVIVAVAGMKHLNLSNHELTVSIDFIERLNQRSEVSPLDTQILFQFDVKLLKDDPFAPKLVNFVPNFLILRHGRTEPFVSLFKAILDDFRLFGQLRRPVMV